MNSKLFCSQSAKRSVLLVLAWLAAMSTPHAVAEAPAWMRTLVNAPVPAHDDKTEAVALYTEKRVSVESADKVRTVVRGAYKILRPGGRDRGTVVVGYNSHIKIRDMHGWCIPTQGKDYEVKNKDAVEVSLPKIAGSELVLDVKDKVLVIPAADPGNIVGFEFEQEEQPYALQDIWYLQSPVPVREAHYSLELPPGWEFKTTWLNATEVKPVQSGNTWSWVVTDVKALKPEHSMPPWRGVAGQMAISYFPSGGALGKAFSNWQQMGNWYVDLTRDRRGTSPEMKQKVAELVATASTPLEKMRALARFAQRDIRYVAIELGIGGWQPHPAPDVFSVRYGDCKDKAILLSAMLQEIRVDSLYVVINTERGTVRPETQAYLGAFDHVILAIKLPADVNDSSLYATLQHPKLGKLLFFDPTNELTPFGQIGGYLQANYGLLVTPDGGELVELPLQPPEMNSIRRTGKLTLDAEGTLKGDFEEIRLGDRAREQRAAIRTVNTDAERIKPIEALLSHALSTFQITQANLSNQQDTSQPFEYHYSVTAPAYAKRTGNLVLVRPRVVGSKSDGFLEVKEPRQLPVVFEGPLKDTDTFEIALPPGYEVDELPPPINIDYSFASYHSKSEVSSNVLRYTRTFEVKELSVPLAKVEDLRRLYRIIGGDERNTAVLKSVSH
jgi:hypothetical protein